MSPFAVPDLGEFATEADAQAAINAQTTPEVADTPPTTPPDAADTEDGES